MYKTIVAVLEQVDFNTISPERKKDLVPLVTFIQNKKNKGQGIHLHFICTHNSRRSQFSQVWAAVAAAKFEIPVEVYSGGVEVTAFNKRAVASLERFGFKITETGTENPVYKVAFNDESPEVTAFSKLVTDSENPSAEFAAIMTCSDADENCPVVTGCEKRIPIRYNDPKKYDDSPLEQVMYDYRSFEIATELMYVFSLIS